MLVCSHDDRALAFASRYASAQFVAPNPLREPRAYHAAVIDAGRRFNADAIIPVADQSILVLGEDEREVAPMRLVGPSRAAFERISDKHLLLDRAERVGIRIPAQAIVAGPIEQSSLPPVAYPVVVKPHRSVAGRQRLSVAYASEPDALHRILMALPPDAYPVLLQERLSGPGTGVFLLRWEDRIVASFAHRRLREQPPTGGHAVMAESIIPPPELLERSIALLAAFGWNGVAMVEYKLDRDGGCPYLMEVNGRFWGSLQLAIDAGVDFPALAVDAAMGRPLPPTPPAYRPGVRLRVWWEDVDLVLTRFRRSREALGLPATAPSAWSVARDFLHWTRHDRIETLRRDDFRPFLRETAQWVRLHFTHRQRH